MFLQVFKERKWLGNISYKNGVFEFLQDSGGGGDGEDENFPKIFSQILDDARNIVAAAAKAAQKIPVPDQVRTFSV